MKKKYNAVNFNTVSLSPALRKGFLTIAIAGLFSGCAKIPHGSMYSEDRQLQQQAALQPALSISKDIDLVRVSGLVGSGVEAAMIRLRVASIYGAEMLIDDLRVDESLMGAEWYSAVLDTAESMRDVEQFSITVENGQVRLDGKVQSQASAEALASNATSALGQQLVVSSEIDYPGRESVIAQAATSEPAQPLAIATTTPLPVANNSNESLDQQVAAEQRLSAQSIPSPAVSSTLPLPVTTSAMVLEQRTAADNNNELFVPPADADSTSSNVTGDSDGDGIVDSMDECQSRPGYPVDAKGCQALDGMLKNVRFQDDSNQLSNEAMRSLNNVARVMNEYPAARIAILSYASNSGSPLETRSQSRDRARSVVGYLINKGVESTRLEAYAFGHINNSEDQIMIKEVD